MGSNAEVLLLAHGSRSPDYAVACKAFLDDWLRYSGTHARFCFLEQCEPLLEDVLKGSAAKFRVVVILPLLLNAGMHLRQDIPDRLAGFRRHHPETDICFTDGLTDEGVIAEALHGRAIEIHANMKSIILLTHGSRQNGIREYVERLADMLAQRAGAEVHLAFSGYGDPIFADVLAQQMGRGHVAIVPHFLFPGGWMQQVQTDMDTFKHAHSGIDLALAKPLGAHPCTLRLLQQQLNSVRNPKNRH